MVGGVRHLVVPLINVPDGVLQQSPARGRCVCASVLRGTLYKLTYNMEAFHSHKSPNYTRYQLQRAWCQQRPAARPADRAPWMSLLQGGGGC